jgi:hypothetical protein
MGICFPSFYFTRSHFLFVLIYMLSDFLCHLVSLPFCMCLYGVLVSMSLCHLVSLPFYMGFYVVRVSMSLGLYFRSVGVYMLSNFLCYLVSLPCCMYIYGVLVSMSLGLTSVLYGFLCCPSFYVTWSHFRSIWVSVF